MLTGCLGGRTSFTPNNPLTEVARALRESSAPPPDYPRELAKTPAEPYVVEPGDVLLVQPSSFDSPVRLPGDQPVLPDGTIQLGRYGRLMVAGKTIDQIETEVNVLIRSKEPEAEKNGNGPILVRLVTRDSKVFYVLGEVNAPGAFPLRGRETVLDAIVIAGGLNTNASRKNILLSRPTPPDNACRKVLPVNYDAIVQLGDTTTNYQIRAGDRVFVPSRTCREDLENLFHRRKEKDPLCGLAPCFPAGGPFDGAPLLLGEPVGPLVKGAPAKGLPAEIRGTTVTPGKPEVLPPPAPLEATTGTVEVSAPAPAPLPGEGPVKWSGQEPLPQLPPAPPGN
jgi:polysaccharide export outer membrane protein